MIVPTIHLNGTSREGLLEPLEVAYSSIREMEDAFQKTVPNGRDYYPQGPEAYEAARKQHLDQALKLQEVRKYLEDLCQAIDKAPGPR